MHILSDNNFFEAPPDICADHDRYYAAPSLELAGIEWLAAAP
jgi:hypothetical protein